MIQVVMFFIISIFHLLLMCMPLEESGYNIKRRIEVNELLNIQLIEMIKIKKTIPRDKTFKQLPRDLRKTSVIEKSNNLTADETQYVGNERNVQPQIIPPEYPREARRKKQSGQVVVEYQIDPAGLVKYKKIIKSSGHELLDQSALESVEKNKHILSKLIKDVITFNFTLKM